MTARLAIIGGGPKAVAIASKAKILNDAHLLDCEVHVFENREIGSSWSGSHGYTDGAQALCTPAEKDLGFPYVAFPGAHGAAEEMMSQFSWGTFKASRGYADWVDQGRGTASHGEFAEYLSWAFDRSEAILHRGTVVGLEIARFPGKPVRKGWRIRWTPRGRRAPVVMDDPFEGVVVTGHGPPRALGPSSHPLLFDGRNFWTESSRRSVAQLVGRGKITEDSPLVVIGSGGTAAAVLAWFARQGFQDLPMHLLAEQATFYTRGDSVFENRLFSDPTHWRALTHGTRKLFFDRLTRGVVWQTVMQDLVRLTALRFVDGKATSITPAATGNLTVRWTRRLSRMELERGEAPTGEAEAGLVINATGFNNWWFLDLLPPGTVPTLGHRRNRLLRKLADGMGEDLAFRDGWRQPVLHAPFQSMMVGPGFASLLALGDMADRVLRSYIAPSGIFPP